MALQPSTARLGALVDDTAIGQTDVDQLIRDIFPNTNADIAGDAAVEITLIGNLERPAYLQSASFIPETAVALAANSMSAQVFYDDGAAGAAVALSDLWDGTALTSLAAQRNALANPLVGTLIPAGSRVYIDLAWNGAGAAWDDTGFEAKLRYE